MPSLLVVAFVSVLAQPSGALFDDVLDALHARDPALAQRRLEHLADDDHIGRAERAHAASWAGQLAVRRGDVEAARTDFQRARRIAPETFDGRMAAVHEGEADLAARRFAEAEAVLAPYEHDPDAVIATYAQARLRALRQRVPRRVLRYGSETVLLLGLGALALRMRAALRHRPRRLLPSFGRALLLTESVAIAAAAAVPRLWTSLAQSGVMAAAIPSSLALALAWSLRPRSFTARAAALTAVMAAVFVASALYLALDLTWWSVEDPML